MTFPDSNSQEGGKVVPLNGIAATVHHDEGAYARCSYCGRYSLDPMTLGKDRQQPVCECGEQHYWSGSFIKPGPDAKWSGASPTPSQEGRSSLSVEGGATLTVPTCGECQTPMPGHSMPTANIFCAACTAKWRRTEVQPVAVLVVTEGRAPEFMLQCMAFSLPPGEYGLYVRSTLEQA